MTAKSPATMTGRLGIVFTIAGLSAIPIPFIPFAVDYVPISDMEWHWSKFPHFTLVVPCIALPPMISIGYIAWHVAGRLPAWTPIAGYGLAAVSVTAFLAGLLSLFRFAFAGSAWLGLKGVDRDCPVRGLILMQCVYVTLMVFAIATARFWGGLQIGGWLGVTALFAYVGQIAAALKRYRLLLVIVLPLALIGWISNAV